MPKINDPIEPRLSINLFDIDRVDQLVRDILLGGKLKLDAIWVDRSRVDETAVEFTCPIQQAAAICDIIRSHDREAGDHPTRVYVFRSSAWSKLPSTALVAEMFKEPEKVESVPLATKAIQW